MVSCPESSAFAIQKAFISGAGEEWPGEYDLVILGGGTGSTIAAWTFAAEGKRVAVIDRKCIGRSCPNIVCLHSKNIIHNAKVASYFRHRKEFATASRLICQAFVTASTRWYPA
jgi:pyruvate/2-oxoglutarate dehydrogenase complex dihydrolipoamide dehydrogenase (E3) component